MAFSPLIDNLIEALCVLPGVGRKTAERMAFYLLERDRSGGSAIAATLKNAMEKVDKCSNCRNLCETNVCDICSDLKRNQNLLCVVETPADVAAIERTMGFGGLYFVLLGHLSPLDGIGPHDIGVPLFTSRLKAGVISEVILATNTTVEGEATAYYLSDIAAGLNIKATRIAHGVPLGGELDRIDGGTLAKAIARRLPLEVD